MQRLKEDIAADWYMQELINFSSLSFREFHHAEDHHAEDHLDAWFNKNIFDGEWFPIFSQVVKTALCIFHWQRVDSSFNVMDDIIDKSTFSSIQTEYGLKVRSKSAKTMFIKKDFRHDAIDPNLVRNLTNAHSLHYKRRRRSKKCFGRET